MITVIPVEVLVVTNILLGILPLKTAIIRVNTWEAYTLQVWLKHSGTHHCIPVIIFYIDLFNSFNQEGLNSQESQRPFSSSPSSNSSIESEYQHQAPIPIVSSQQHHVNEHPILEQITDHNHIYDSYAPCGYNNNHHQVTNSCGSNLPEEQQPQVKLQQ